MTRKHLLVAALTSIAIVGLAGVAAARSPLPHAGPPSANATHEVSGRSLPNFARPKGHASATPASTSALFYQHTDAPVVFSGHTYAIFWLPPGWSYASNFEYMMYRYFSDIGQSPLFNINTQYYQTYYGQKYAIPNQSTWGGFYEDHTGYPANRCNNPVTGSRCLLDSDIQAAVIRAVVANNWPSGTNNLYFVYTAYGEGSCFDATCASSSYTPGIGNGGYCAYHYSFSNAGKWFIYANMPYAKSGFTATCHNVPAAPSGSKAIDAEISLTSHEHFEMVTDPYGGVLNNGYAAWQGSGGLQDENGDKCAWVFGALSYGGGTANQLINGHYYIMQTEFSNRAYYAQTGATGHPGCVTS